MVSEKIQQQMLELGTHPHIVEVARRVHPTFIAANGHKDDPGVEQLAREIGQCIAALNHLREQGEDIRNRYVVGDGLMVSCSDGLFADVANYQVAVVAGVAYGMRIELGVQ